MQANYNSQVEVSLVDTKCWTLEAKNTSGILCMLHGPLWEYLHLLVDLIVVPSSEGWVM